MAEKVAQQAEDPIEQHPLGKSVFLHLFPGFVFTVIYVLIVRLTAGNGVPPLFTFLIAGLSFLVPFELGFLLYQAKTRNRSFSLKGIVSFRNRIPKWQYMALPALLLGWVFFIALVVNPPLEKAVLERFFSWVPQPYVLESLVNQANQYSRSLLVVSAIIGIFLNGIFGPLVEELYFRGYLLPRMSRLGLWAPFLNTVLFSLYHFFTPWQNPLRVIALTPVFYVVWQRKNIHLGIIVHCLMNLAGSLMLLMAILKLSGGR
jgi:membrane protease YdiL (CAAX protease family)